MAIEVTPEMIAAFERDGTGGYGDITDTRAGLAAVLAIVERDYINVDHVHRYGRICPPGNRCVYCTPGGTS